MMSIDCKKSATHKVCNVTAISSCVRQERHRSIIPGEAHKLRARLFIPSMALWSACASDRFLSRSGESHRLASRTKGIVRAVSKYVLIGDKGHK